MSWIVGGGEQHSALRQCSAVVDGERIGFVRVRTSSKPDAGIRRTRISSAGRPSVEVLVTLVRFSNFRRAA